MPKCNHRLEGFLTATSILARRHLARRRGQRMDLEKPHIVPKQEGGVSDMRSQMTSMGNKTYVVLVALERGCELVFHAR